MRTYCVDFDDLCDEVAERSLEQLVKLRETTPNFKATLFTIPNRTSQKTVQMYKRFDWLALAPHGWRHTRGECLSWAVHEAVAKITLAQEHGIDAPVFRAPAWLINRATYEACIDTNLVVADHSDNYLHVPGTKVYRYNDPAWRQPDITPVHGHLTQCAVDNYIGDMIVDNRLSFADKPKFVWPWQAAKEVECES